MGKGNASPGWEGKNSYDSSRGAPGRSRMGQVNRGDETPDRGAAVPKFGEWDESNPSSADGYTDIFNKVREEKNSAAGKAPSVTNGSSYTNTRKQNTNDDVKLVSESQDLEEDRPSTPLSDYWDAMTYVMIEKLKENIKFDLNSFDRTIRTLGLNNTDTQGQK
ncbi:hypothetical protein TEA_017163 [Camellia sinensis var. sinensis]|uniref:RIN4 pathogenic type III effector avirulence factor Avr cleavage site domain-containing protein n=1 Tax=Camellia sinensis var. sinensis TaxID=542762 RepID=A0A4S4ENF1_CAMSN|nr:hypothetical protein TEA_017163 [Camellia sinensis var. sinensis]